MRQTSVTYDAAGNIASITNAASSTTDQLTSYTASGIGHRASGIGTVNYSWDNNGNLQPRERHLRVGLRKPDDECYRRRCDDDVRLPGR